MQVKCDDGRDLEHQNNGIFSLVLKCFPSKAQIFHFSFQTKEDKFVYIDIKAVARIRARRRKIV